MAENAGNDANTGEKGKKDGKKLRILLRTFGCQMNFRDSEALLGLFLECGYSRAENPKEADVILVNACSVRAHAENRAMSFLGSLKKTSRSTVNCPRSTEKNKTVDYRLSAVDFQQRRKPIVGLIGCMAKNRGEELFKKMPHINLIVAPNHLDKIPCYVNEIADARRRRIIDLEDCLRNEEFYRASFRTEPDCAQVVISTGCSNHCSYCIVPYVRGELRLRNPEDIIDEIKVNVDLGIKKITLLGQNVNDYSHTSHVTRYTSHVVNFVNLLTRINKIDGVEEIDFVTSHPKNISKELFDFMAQSIKIKKRLHLPFQSGSNRILSLMNRGYTKEEYLELVDYYKKKVAGSLGTDVITGFPGETEQDFLETKDVLRQVRFDRAYIFKYSPRPHTHAAELKDDILKEVKEMRHKILLDLQKRISFKRG